MDPPLDSGVPAVTGRGDAPMHEQGGVTPQVVPYGSSVYWGDAMSPAMRLLPTGSAGWGPRQGVGRPSPVPPPQSTISR